MTKHITTPGTTAEALRVAHERFPVRPGYVDDRYVEDVHRAEREGFRLGWLAARQPAPVDADHTVTAEWDGGYGGTTFTFRCHAGPESECHAVYDCACEEWTHVGIEDGRPWHEAYDREADKEVRHVGTFDPNECNLRDWFENTDDPMYGSLTFAVEAEYQGDFYLFRPAQEVPRG